VTLCSGGSWSERREGLYALQHQLRAEQRLKYVASEIKLIRSLIAVNVFDMQVLRAVE